MMSDRNYRMPTEEELFDYFFLCELGAAGATDATWPRASEPSGRAASTPSALPSETAPSRAAAA